VRVYERVDPDGQLVSARGAARVYALDGPGRRLPDDSILYLPPAQPQMRFRFTIVRCANGDYRAYIREQPNYAGRAADAHSSHRLHDRHGHFICWAPMPRTARGILAVAKLWADRTARYIATGKPLHQS
jgi:hypothetical protein